MKMSVKLMYVLVAEHDSPDIFDSNGAIIFETYTKNSTKEEVIERAKSFGNRYGRMWIAKLEILEEFCDE